VKFFRPIAVRWEPINSYTLLYLFYLDPGINNQGDVTLRQWQTKYLFSKP